MSVKRQPSDIFLTYLPECKVLKKYIAYYYLHYSNDPEGRTSFEYYPHFRNAVTCYLDSERKPGPQGWEIYPGRKSSSITIFSRNYDSRIHVQINGVFRKLGIAFESLGINHFVNQNLSEIAPATENIFDQFGPELEALNRTIYADESIDRVKLLDAFMTSKYNGFENGVISEAVDLLLKSSGGIAVEDLALHFNISRKTLLRMFQRHLCISVEGYKRLIRFRNALNQYYNEDGKTSFTQLALEHQYYDQPAFVRHFKLITGLSPRAFFAQLRRYGDRDTYWSPR